MLTLEKRKSPISKCKFIPQETENEEQDDLKASWREEIIKFRAETTDIENRKTTEKTNKTKDWFFKKNQ